MVIGWLLRTRFSNKLSPAIADESSFQEVYHLIDDESTLQGPTPVLIANPKGGPRFSISLPPQLQYPLKPSEYSTLCSKSDDLARWLRHQNSRSGYNQNRGIKEYYHKDPNFMDVREAEQEGILPVTQNRETSSSLIVLDDLPQRSVVEDFNAERRVGSRKICEKSLTYVLETTDAGIGNTLLNLWLSYGLAKEDGRAFFIDDSNW